MGRQEDPSNQPKAQILRPMAQTVRVSWWMGVGLSKEFPESGMCAGRGDGSTVAREPRVLLLIPSGFLVEAPGMRTGTAGEPLGFTDSTSSRW